MSKSALIIDTPSTCSDCGLMGGKIANKVLCNASGATVISDGDGRPSECPLKELPFLRTLPSEYTLGWNACLKKMGGIDE